MSVATHPAITTAIYPVLDFHSTVWLRFLPFLLNPQIPFGNENSPRTYQPFHFPAGQKRSHPGFIVINTVSLKIQHGFSP